MALVSETLKGPERETRSFSEPKGWRVNVKETKIMNSSESAGKVLGKDKFPCVGCIRDIAILGVN